MRILATALILTVACSVSAKTIYVDDDATCANNGTSWENAWIYLQDALADANSSPKKPVEVRVAQGIYKPDGSRFPYQENNERELKFRLMDNVSIIGGYAGTSYDNPDERNPEAYVSVLSGDLFSDDAPDSNLSDNSYCVVEAIGVSRSALLDGFQITGGMMKDTTGRGGGIPWTSDSRSGGGLRSIAASPIIRHCKFRGNNVDVFVVDGSNPLLVGCDFSNPRSRFPNGARGTLTSKNSHTELQGCVFQDNRNGAVFSDRGKLQAIGCDFLSNSIEPVSWGGGAINIDEGELILSECRFKHNHACLGGAIFVDRDTNLIVEDCVFIGNSADFGGAICFASPFRPRDFSIEIRGCEFKYNCGWVGGALFMNTTSETHISHCTFENNQASRSSVAFSALSVNLKHCLITGNQILDDVDHQYWGMDMLEGRIPPYGNMLDAPNVQVSNCTLHGNRSGYGFFSTFGNPATICNSIVWNELQSASSALPQLDISYSNLIESHEGRGNISAEPLFVKPGYWDPNGTPQYLYDDYWVSGDYHLRSQAGRWGPDSNSWVQDDVTSPCIDAGDPMGPIQNEPFPNGGVVNMGAYGATVEASKPWFGQPACNTNMAGDINGDCKVDFIDFAIVAGQWMTEL